MGSHQQFSQMIRNPRFNPYGTYILSNDHILHCIHTGLNIGGGKTHAYVRIMGGYENVRSATGRGRGVKIGRFLRT